MAANERSEILLETSSFDRKVDAAQSPKTGAGRGDHRIMLAEDSPTMRELIKTTLIRAGYDNLTICNDGQEAWGRLERGVAAYGRPPVDLLITEIDMPRMDGLYLTRRIKEHGQLNQVPVVVFSSLVSPDNEKRCQSVGADAQIARPQLDELVNLIDRLLTQTGGGSHAVAVHESARS